MMTLIIIHCSYFWLWRIPLTHFHVHLWVCLIDKIFYPISILHYLFFSQLKFDLILYQCVYIHIYGCTVYMYKSAASYNAVGGHVYWVRIFVHPLMLLCAQSRIFFRIDETFLILVTFGHKICTSSVRI